MNSKTTVKSTPRAPAGFTWLRALEPRMMFDGAVAATVAETAQADPAPQADSASDNQSDSTPPAAPAATSDQRQEIIFIDSNVQNYAQLINGVSEGTEVVVLDGNKDGLQQIADYLNGRSGIDAIHIVSHGSLGQITLGAVTLDQAALSEQAATLSVVGQALTDTGDIFLYGCYVGQAQQGQSFVDEFSLLTGADVAASTDMTSGGQAGGNWVLEYQTGEVVSTLDLASIWSGYAGTLVSIPSNITIDFAGDGFVETADHGSNVYTNGDIKITYSAANWFQDADDGQGGSAALFAGASSGIETITIETNSGNEFDFASFFINAFGGGFASVEGFRDGASTGLQTTGTGFGQTNGSFTVLMNDAIFNNVDRVVITSNAWGFFDIFDTFVLNAVPSNAPTLTATGTNPGFIENGSPVDLFSGVTAATNDTGQNFTGAVFTVTNVSNGASEVLSIDGTSIALNNGASGSLANGGSYSVTVAAGTATVTLSGMSRSNAQMGTLIDNITYGNSSDDPGNSNRVVTITAITDSGSNNNTLTPNIASTVSVTPVNDAPTVTATGYNPIYTENGGAVSLFSGAIINTVETGQTITGMTLTVTNLADGSDEILRIDGTDVALLNGSNGTTAGNGISYSIGIAGGTATITLSSAAGLSTAATQTVVNGMTYRNSSDAPSTATRVITLTSITDSGGTANGGVDTTATAIATSVSVIAVNDAPVVTPGGGSSNFTEGGSSTVVDSGLTLSDPDNATLPSATVSISGNFQPGADVLIFVNDGSTMGNISASYNAGTGVLSMTSAGATATLAQWQAALRSVSYSNSSDAPSTANRTVSFVVNDGQDNSTAATKIVSVTAINDAPQITAPATIGVTEDVPSAITGISFSDVDAGSANVTVTLSIGSGALSATSGGGVTVGGTASALTLTGSIANINSFIAGSNLRFTTAVNATADVTLTVNINDGGNTGNGGAQSANETIVLQVAEVNDAPTISGPISIPVVEDVPKPLTGITFSDIDAGTGSVTVIFSVASGNGTLTGTASSGVTISNSGTNAITLEGTVADINTMISNGRLTYLGALNATGVKTLSVSINDNGNTGSGGALQVNANISLVIDAVNDAPVNSVPTAQSVDQDSHLVFNASNGNLISISDVDAGSNTVRVTLTANNGLLTLASINGLQFLVGSGTLAGTLTVEGSLTDINNALNGLIFSPTAGHSGSASLQIVTSDLGNSGSGGAQTDSDTVSITVNSLSPRITDVSSSTANGTYKIGDTITITTTFNQIVTVDTTGGSPTLLLETGAIDRNAIYVSGSGSNILTFSYTVQAGDLSADLNYQSTAALSLNGSTIRGASANDAVLVLPNLGAAGSLGANKALVVDGVRPVATSITLSDTALSIGETATVTITFNEAVTGLTLADFTTSNGMLSNLSTSDNITWTATFTPNANVSDATNRIILDNTGVQDQAGNNGAGSADSSNYAIDTLRPTATIVVTDSALKAGQTTTVTITFSEAVSGLSLDDFSVANGTLSNLSTSDNITYTAILTPSNNVTDTTNLVTLDNTGVQDVAGNTGIGSTDSNNYAIDTQRPTASIVVADTALRAGQTTTVTITFNEAVTGLTTADFSVANGALSNLSSNDGGLTWTATLTPSVNVTDPTNLITLDNAGYTDLAGNAGLGTTDSNNYAIDSLRPTATITVADNALSIGETTTVTITFSKAITGLDTADFSVTNGSLSGLSSSDGGITWTATFTPSANVSDATNVITLDNTGYIDSAGNTGTGTTDSGNYAIDTQRPTASILVADSALNAGQSTTVTITFSEAVSGLSLADFNVANGVLSNLNTSDNITWTATLTPSANITDSSNLITLDNSGVQDAAGNAGAGSTDSNNYAIDTQRPTATILVADTVLKAGQDTTVTITFSEAVSGLSLDDFSVANGGLSGLSSNDGGITWTATLTPNANITDSSNLITLNNTGYTDAAGNTGTGTTDSNNYAIDTTAPVINSVSVPAGVHYNAGDTLTFVVNTSENVIVDGTPRLAIDMGSSTVFAEYVAGSGTATLVFQYSIEPGDNDADGISINGLHSNGATLRDAAGNDMSLALNNVGDSSGVVVDTLAPSASAIVVLDPSPTNADSVRYTVVFSENVTGVDLSDFSLVSSGNASGTLGSLIRIDGRTFQVTVNNVAGNGTLALALNASGSGISDTAGNPLVSSFVGQAYSLMQSEGDPEFRANPPSHDTGTPSTPLQPTLPGLPPPPTTSPLLPPPLFEVPTLGSGIPTLGNIFINQNPLAPSYIAQVFASSSDSAGNGSGVGFLGFGGGDGGVFGSSSLSGIFSKDVQQESEQLEVFDGKKWGSGGAGEIFGAPTLGQQLHDLHESEQRQHRELALALQQIAATQPPA